MVEAKVREEIVDGFPKHSLLTCGECLKDVYNCQFCGKPFKGGEIIFCDHGLVHRHAERCIDAGTRAKNLLNKESNNG